MRWPWQKPSKPVQEALDSSARRLVEAERRHEELQPQLRRLQTNAAGNHFAEAVNQLFEVRTVNGR